MADVLLARSDGIEGFERHVVIKRIRPELAGDRRFIRMFLDEARLAATLHHQNIVQVHDIGEEAGEYFIAMEYVHGEDTRRLLSSAARQRSHVPLGYALAIVSAAAAGLHHAHERLGSDRQPLDIVHRDVSPSNILISYDGAIKLVDFGIATASMRPETRSGSLKGKLSYMSPEQCSGAPVDRRTDVYALGVVLYELATTTRMIKGESDYLVMEQIVRGKIAPPQSRRAELPDALSGIILRALATDRERRYATADEMRIALEQFAWTAGLTAPASAIATYMRQQFGHRPEPWLEIGDRGGIELADLPAPPGARISSASWSGQPASRERARSSSISQISQSGSQVSSPFGSQVGSQSGSQPSSYPGPRDPLAASDAEPASGPRTPGAPPAPESTVGWDKHAAAPPAKAISLHKLAVIGAVAATLAVIWLAAAALRSGSTEVATPAPAPAPVVAVAAVPPPAPPPVAPDAALAVAEPASAEPVAPARRSRTASPSRANDAEPAPARARPERAARTASAAQSPVETAAGRGKLERPGAAAEAPASGGDGEAEVHRAPAPPPAAPLPPSAAPPPPAPTIAAVASPAPPVAAAAQIVAPAALEANRIAGNKLIAPDGLTQDAINRAGSDALVSTYKVCVTADGAISLVAQMKSSGFPVYDEKIRSTIRAEWRYRPYLVAGVPTPVCTALRFVYSH